MHHADKGSARDSIRVSIKCFCESFAGIFGDPVVISNLPTSSKPIDGYGIIINLTDRSQWQPFATWIIKILNKCLSEGTLYVEALVNSTFVSSACTFLCYGDADLQMVGSIFLFVYLVYEFDWYYILQTYIFFTYLFNLWTHIDTII